MPTTYSYKMDPRRYMDLTNHLTAVLLCFKALMTNTSTDQSLGWFIFACMYMGMGSPSGPISKARLITNTLGVLAAALLVIGNVA